MKQPLYQGNQFASSRVPQQAIESQHPMAGLWQRSAAVAAQAGENIEQALIDRQEFTLRQNREAQLRQSMDELNAEMAQRLALADGAEGSFFDANGRLNASAVSEIKRRYGRLSNTWTKGFINPDSIQAATVAQQKYLDSLASSIDSSILSAIRPRAQAAYRRNIDAAVASGDYNGALRIAGEAHDAGQTSDTEFYLTTAGVNDARLMADLNAMNPQQLERALYSDDYKDFFQRNSEVADKIRKQINRRNRTTPSSPGGLRVVRPAARATAPTTVRAAYNAGRDFYKPKKTPPTVPSEQPADTTEEPTTDTPTEETPTETEEPSATTEAPAPDDAAPTETTEEPTETATPVADAGIDPRMDAPVTADDGLVPAEYTGEETEETVTTTSAHGTATGSISLAPDPKAPKPKVKNTKAKPPVNSSPFIRDFYQRHGLNFKTPEAQREAAAHFRKWLLSRPAEYLDADENLAEAQAYGKETLQLADNIVKNIIEGRQRALSVDVPSFDPNAFLTAATKRWNREYDLEAGKRAKTEAMTAAEADEEEITAAVAKVEAYHKEASKQLAAIHDKVLTDYSFWVNGAGNKKTPVEQARMFQQMYYNAVKDFKHRKGLGFLEVNGVMQADNTYLDPWVDAPAVAADVNLRKAEKDRQAASAQLHADNARGKANLITADINATRLLQRATDAITVYASPKGAGGEVPYRILSANTDEAAAARYVIDATLQNQAATVSFSTAAANSLESSELPDTNSRYVFYIPETAAGGALSGVQPNLLLPLEDGGVLNIELRKTKNVRALTPSRALASRLGILGYQYNAITFDGNCLYFLNREQRPVYGEASIFPTDGEGNPTGLEAGTRFDPGALPAATEY